MSRGKGTREFFEVFSEDSGDHNGRGQDRSRAKKRRFVGSIDATKDEFVRSPESSNADQPGVDQDVFPFSSGKKGGRSPLSKNEVSVKITQEHLVIGLLLGVCLFLVTVFASYRAGKSRGRGERPVLNTASQRTAEQTRPLQMPTTSGSQGAAPSAPRHTPTPRPRATKPAPAAPEWTIAIIAYSDTPQYRQRANDLAAALRALMGATPVFVRQSGDMLVVCVGRFGSYRDEMLLRLMDRLRSMPYEGKHQFTKCYPTKLR